MGMVELLVLGFLLGPMLEESLFRGCLLPVLAQTTGNLAAVTLTALLFALFHKPADLAHWVSLYRDRHSLWQYPRGIPLDHCRGCHAYNL